LGWSVEFDSAAQKQLRKIDRVWQQRIVAYLEAAVELPDPRLRGNPFEAV
jgi:mRNA-degrading endonuclease RelE of RelBE toxin-antitoxin system